jgi:hypothetical protein
MLTTLLAIPSVHVNVHTTSGAHSGLERSIEHVCRHRFGWPIFIDSELDCCDAARELATQHSAGGVTVLVQTQRDVTIDDFPPYARQCKTLVIVNPSPQARVSLRTIRHLISASIHLFPVDVTIPPFADGDDVSLYNNALTSSLLYCHLIDSRP